MSGRTCQLCGKPLSRIWVGSGGDFCSREHRNQYRLRRGMDRVTEASKMASLMRKRESLKPLGAGRTFDAEGPRMADAKPFAAGAKPLALPKIRYRQETGRAFPGREKFRRIAAASSPKAAGRRLVRLNIKTRDSRPHLKSRSLDLRAVRAAYLSRIQKPRLLKGRSLSGNALRVSTGAPFRLPSVQLRGWQPPVPETSVLQASRRVLRAAPKQSAAIAKQTFEIPFPTRAMVIPQLQGTPPAAGTQVRGLTAPRSVIRENKLIHHIAQVAWPVREMVVPEAGKYKSKTAGVFAPKLLPVQPKPVRGCDIHRHAVVLLVPQDATFDPGKEYRIQ